MMRKNGTAVAGKRTALFTAVLLLIVSACAAAVMVQQYRSYDEKMNILCDLTGAESLRAASSEEGTLPQGPADSRPVLESAAEILKGNGFDEENTETGRKILNSYGYGIPAGGGGQSDKIAQSGQNGGNGRRMPDAYQRELRRSWAVTAAAAAAAFLSVFAAFQLFVRRERKLQEKELLETSDILAAFQAGQYGLSADMRSAVRCAERKSARGILGDRLESLAEHLSSIRASSEREKEATRSLVTDLSHQLKTPVAAMGTSLEVLRQESLTEEERREFTERCLRQEERLRDLLGALINISRLESGMIELKFTESRLFDTVASAVSRIYPVAAAKDISISVEAEDSLSAVVIRQDPKWLCEALLNVLENAVKYSPAGTEVKIRVLKLVTFLRVEIEDEGIGIPKDERHKIFQRFYRGGEAAVSKQPGSGVGLYLTRRIVEAHGGMIRASDAAKTAETAETAGYAEERGDGGPAENSRSGERNGRSGRQKSRGRGTTFIIQLPLKTI